MRLDLVIGPNGAGESTFVELILAPARPGVTFVNADVIAAAKWPQDPASHAYDAARLAAATREALIAAGEPFIAETVFSHPSKLDLIARARAAGYTVALHVLVIPEELAVQRVKHRVTAGGHDRARSQGSWPVRANVASGRHRNRGVGHGTGVRQLSDRRAAGGSRVRRRLPRRTLPLAAVDPSDPHPRLARAAMKVPPRPGRARARSAASSSSS